MTDLQHHLCFQVGSQWYGIHIESVVEIYFMMTLTELPVSAPDVLGLMTVRDNVLPVIDMRLRFGIADPTFKLSTPIITIRTAERQMGLVVDDVDNVEPIEADKIVAYDGPEFPYVTGVVKMPGRLLLLLDPNLISREAQALDAEGQAAR